MQVAFSDLFSTSTNTSDVTQVLHHLEIWKPAPARRPGPALSSPTTASTGTTRSWSRKTTTAIRGGSVSRSTT